MSEDIGLRTLNARKAAAEQARLNKATTGPEVCDIAWWLIVCVGVGGFFLILALRWFTDLGV